MNNVVNNTVCNYYLLLAYLQYIEYFYLRLPNYNKTLSIHCSFTVSERMLDTINLVKLEQQNHKESLKARHLKSRNASQKEPLGLNRPIFISEH